AEAGTSDALTSDARGETRRAEEDAATTAAAGEVFQEEVGEVGLGARPAAAGIATIEAAPKVSRLIPRRLARFVQCGTLVAATVLSCGIRTHAATPTTKPNVVLIFAD